MTRWIIAALAVGSITVLSAAPGCGSTGVGDPCTPDEEYDTTFQGFSEQDVSVESKSYVCLSRLCLVNHFRGRVTCPFGQVKPGVGPCETSTTSGCVLPSGELSADATKIKANLGCTIPGGTPGDAASEVQASNAEIAGYSQGQVPPQLYGTTVSPTTTSNRTANEAVYCSCRCANAAGQTNDGANYCTCPSNYTCTQLVTSISAMDPGLTGAYCVLNGSQYAAGGQDCDATASASSPAGSAYCPLPYSLQ